MIIFQGLSAGIPSLFLPKSNFWDTYALNHFRIVTRPGIPQKVSGLVFYASLNVK